MSRCRLRLDALNPVQNGTRAIFSVHSDPNVGGGDWGIQDGRFEMLITNEQALQGLVVGQYYGFALEPWKAAVAAGAGAGAAHA